MNPGRLRLRRDAELLAAEHAATLTAQVEPREDLDADRIEQARRRIAREHDEHGQLRFEAA